MEDEISHLIVLTFFSACDVEVANPDSKELTHGQGYTLKCKVTAPDTFDRWSNPLYKSSIQSDPELRYTDTGGTHDLEIVSMNVFFAGVWTCYSQQGKNDSVTLTFARKYIYASVTDVSIQE